MAISRRTLLGGAGATAFGVASAAALPLFRTPDRKQNPATCRAKDLSASQKEVIISNWPAYIDPPTKKTTSTIQDFEKATGIKVHYTEDVNDNNEFFAKVVNQLGSCQTVNRDMMILTDWMAARMIQMGWIQKLDASKVPNLHKNLLPSLKRSWDPTRSYSAPWQSGLTGLAYNSDKVGEVKSFKELITRPDLKGRISLLTEMRDTMGLMLLSEGADPENFTKAQWETAMDELRKVRTDGQVRAFTGNEYLQDLAAGNIVACAAWSGDIAAAGKDNLKFVVPEEGAMIWSDNMLVPNLATHESNAEEWINYYYEPEVAAKLAAYVYYICPVEGAQQAMEKIDPSAVNNQLIFPTPETLQKTHGFMALKEYQTREYQKEFSDVTGG